MIGAGNTAIDVATAAKRLGAETVTIAYRRSEALMPAFAYEYELAKADGVRFEWFAQPVRIVGESGAASGVEFVRTELEDPTLAAGPGPDRRRARTSSCPPTWSSRRSARSRSSTCSPRCPG